MKSNQSNQSVNQAINQGVHTGGGRLIGLQVRCTGATAEVSDFSPQTLLASTHVTTTPRHLVSVLTVT